MPGQQASQAIDILFAFLTDGTTPAEPKLLLTPIIVDAENLAMAERAIEAGIGVEATPSA